MKFPHLLLRIWGKLALVATCSVLAIALSSQPVWAYNVPEKAVISYSGTRYNQMADANRLVGGYTDQKAKYDKLFPLNPTTNANFGYLAKSLNGHGFITLGAAQVLRGDGMSAVADDMMNHMGLLIDGSMQADTGAGQFTLSAVAFSSVIKDIELNRGSFGHFYNYSDISAPDQTPGGVGFVYDPAGGGNGFLLDANEVFGTMPSSMFTLRGPQTPSTDLANLEYAKAVDLKRRSTKTLFDPEICISQKDCDDKAYQALGRVLHLIQDSTIPQHVTNEGSQEDNSWHTGYEDGVDAFLEKGWINHAASAGLYNLGVPEAYVVNGAKTASGPIPWDSSKRYLDFSAYKDGGFELRPVPPSDEEDNYYNRIMSGSLTANSIVVSRNLKAAKDLVPLAERLSAGILARFYDSWATEQFQVAAVHFVQARDVDGSADSDFPFTDRADLYLKWNKSLSTSSLKKTPAIEGSDDINPNQLSPYNWFYVQWLNTPNDKVNFMAQLWDEDGGLYGGDDRLDLCSQQNYWSMDIVSHPAGSVVNGVVQPQGLVSVCGGSKQYSAANQPKMRPFWAEFSSWGGGNEGYRGYLRGRIERYPTPPSSFAKAAQTTPPLTSTPSPPPPEKCFDDDLKPIPCDP